jgi:hypothetical protein
VIGMVAERNEVSYYDEIMAFIKEQIESNFAAWEKPLKVYCKTGELQKGLKDIVRENNISTPAIINFAASTPPLSLDIFALITDGIKYELLIIEVKLMRAVGLTQLSQLIGYCIVSNAQYGLLVNVNGGESPRLTNLIMNEPDLMYIVRSLTSKHETVEHNLGVMEWDSDTQNLTYTGFGAVRTISELCKKLEEKFRKE